MEHEKKSLLLQKQEDEDRDWTKTEKTRSSVESLQSDIVCLKESISRSCSSISKLIDEELHPQLIAVTSGYSSGQSLGLVLSLVLNEYFWCDC